MQIWIQNPSFSVNNSGNCTAAEPKAARVALLGAPIQVEPMMELQVPSFSSSSGIFPPSHTEHWESGGNSCSPGWSATSCANGKQLPPWPQFFLMPKVSNLGSGEVICIYKPDISHWEFHTGRNLCLLFSKAAAGSFSAEFPRAALASQGYELEKLCGKLYLPALELMEMQVKLPPQRSVPEPPREELGPEH